MTKKMRKEEDLLGEQMLPADVYWGISTQRALKHFNISGKTFPLPFVLSLAIVKKACLQANIALKKIDTTKAKAMEQALDEILQGKFFEQFPIDVFISGSGTQINMNINEVVANRANELLGFPLGSKSPVHPNDDVNMGQSSNDVVPTAMHLATISQIKSALLPALTSLEKTLTKKINAFKGIIKVGRTHLQDAVPIPLSLEFQVYREQIARTKVRLEAAFKELSLLPIGGTVLGTGLNASPQFTELVIQFLQKQTAYPLASNPVKAEGIASHNTIVFTSSILKSLALTLIKMANDIRWMGSGPRVGLGELLLPQNEPGSSMMPGKVNPTQAEAIIQVCQQVIGNDTVITIAESTSSLLDLNVAKPVMIVNLLESIRLLANGIRSFTTFCLEGLEINKAKIEEELEKTLMVVTRLTPLIGYDKAGEIAKKALVSGKTIREVMQELNIKLTKDIEELLNPKKMV